MSTYETECDICGHKQSVARDEPYLCKKCGQDYDVEGGHVVLSNEQMDLLRAAHKLVVNSAPEWRFPAEEAQAACNLKSGETFSFNRETGELKVTSAQRKQPIPVCEGCFDTSKHESILETSGHASIHHARVLMCKACGNRAYGTMRWVRFKPQSIRDQVDEFKKMCMHPMPSKPESPPEVRIRLCLSMVMEECLELVLACTNDIDHLRELSGMIQHFILTMPLNVCMPDAADSCGDIDYTVEGFRREFGIDGRPIAEAIHEANMKKQDGPVDPSTGKKLKPPGFEPPDIAGELKRQGWTG